MVPDGAAFGGIRHVVRALDAALVALAVLGGDLLDDVLDPDVEEQRPFAVLTDVDQPRLQRVVLVIADLVLADGLMHRVEHLAGEHVDPLGRGVLDGLERRLVGMETLGGRSTRRGGRASRGVLYGGHFFSPDFLV